MVWARSLVFTCTSSTPCYEKKSLQVTHHWKHGESMQNVCMSARVNMCIYIYTVIYSIYINMYVYIYIYNIHTVIQYILYIILHEKKGVNGMPTEYMKILPCFTTMSCQMPPRFSGAQPLHHSIFHCRRYDRGQRSTVHAKVQLST